MNIPIQQKPEKASEKRIQNPSKSLNIIDHNITFDFSKFQIKPVKAKDYNGFYRDNESIRMVLCGLLGQILPKLSSTRMTQLVSGDRDIDVLHFHPIDEQHLNIVIDILIAYGFAKEDISQMCEGNDLICFSAVLGHVNPARVVCHKLNDIGVLQVLFIDVNHHIYINDRYVKDSIFYETCPNYLSGSCSYMPQDCFAVSYLDEKKYCDSFGLSCEP